VLALAERVDGEVPSSGYRDSGVLASAAYNVGPGTLRAGWEGDYARDIGLPAPTGQTTTIFLPEENSSRFTVAYDTQPVARRRTVTARNLIESRFSDKRAA